MGGTKSYIQHCFDALDVAVNLEQKTGRPGAQNNFY